MFDLPEEGNSITYEMYMGGDIAETVISTGREDLPNILIFGDSFTNAVETFMYTGFNEMRSIDLRHYTQMGIKEYIDLYKPDIVVCIRDDTSYLLETGNGNLS